jgi:hypothetical protein
VVSLVRPGDPQAPAERERMPVVLTPDPSPLMGQA